MTIEEYNNIIDKLKDCFNYYDRIGIQDNKYQLYLANGDVINVKTLPNSVAHLLGINIDNLRLSGKIKKDMNSYEILKYFLDESYSFGKLASEGKINLSSIFSKHIIEKLEAFETNINIRTDDIHCVVAYDNERSYQCSEHSDISDYYIIRRRNNFYYILGLVKKENSNIYLPSTSRKYDFTGFDKFMTNLAKKQEITYPHLMKINNPINRYNPSFYFSMDNHIAILDRTIKLSEHYNATAATSKDFLYSLTKAKNQKDANSNHFSIIRLLIDNLKKGNVLDTDTIREIVGDVTINDDISDLIDACNNAICTDSNNDKALKNYSSLSEENLSLKNELKKMKTELNKMKEQNRIYEEECKKLSEQKDIYEKQLEIYNNAFDEARKLQIEKSNGGV